MIKKIFLILNFLIFLLMIGCFEEREINKDHQLFNDDISYYFTIKGTPKYILDFEGRKQMINSYDVFVTFEQNNILVDKVRYEINYINAINERFSLFNNLKTPGETLPFNKQILSQNTIGGNGFKEIFGLMRYYKNDITLESNFYEKIILLENDDVKLVDYLDTIQTDLLNFYLNTYEREEYYQINFTIELNNNQRHIDFQSWFVDENLDIFPFVGIYSYFSSNNIIIINNNQLYKDIKVKTLYMQLHYYDMDKNKNIFLWKVSIDDIKENAIK